MMPSPRHVAAWMRPGQVGTLGKNCENHWKTMENPGKSGRFAGGNGDRIYHFTGSEWIGLGLLLLRSELKMDLHLFAFARAGANSRS